MTGTEPEVGPDRATAALDWTPAGPRSRRFDDVYFSATDGLADARAVFLQGCGLPEAWRGRRRFVVGELGFGTGLTLLAAIELWRRTRAPGAKLNLFSVEAFPLSRTDAARALGAWPKLADLTNTLLAAWPDDRRGFHRIEFPLADATLDLWIGEVAEGLQAWSGQADAWFLDGFAPARNPEMWRGAVLALLAARSAPGARAASFTVAGAVRRGLDAVGFEVVKRPGFGAKRERLEAVRRGDPRPEQQAPASVAILGAGVAGAALARAFRRLGTGSTVFDPGGPGAGASGNPAALVSPRLDAGFAAPARLHAQAFARAVELYRAETRGAIIAEGALQLETSPRDADRFARIAAWSGFASGAQTHLSPGDAAARLGEAVGPGGLWLRDALTLAPAAVLDAWFGTEPPIQAGVAALARVDGGWRLTGEGARPLGVFDAVVLAAGPATRRLLGALAAPAPLRVIRGQASWTGMSFSGCAAAWGGYALPMADGGYLFGATHDRDDEACDLRVADHARNLALLAKGRPVLAAAVAAEAGALDGRASLRIATPDHLPLAGAVAAADGVHALTGLGGRGFTLAPLLAEHVAAGVVGAPSPLPCDLAAAVDPSRFDAPRSR